MPSLRLASALLPALTVILTAYALRPRTGPPAPDGSPCTMVAPLRMAVVRAAVAVGAFAVLGAEALSAVNAIAAGPIVLLWLAGLAVAGAMAAWRHRRDARLADSAADSADSSADSDGRGVGGGRAFPGLGAMARVGAMARRVATVWRTAKPAERLLAGAFAILVLAELVLAIGCAPNNYDSNFYHLPKVEHWVAQHRVGLYATIALPQVILAPGAEILLLHLRVLTGGDLFYNLVQWAAALGCALVASRIAAQLGAGRLGQLLAACTVAGAPMVALEATSTQNDMVVAAWVVCTASLVLDELRRRSGPSAVVAIGTAAGLVIVTKATGWVALGPVLLLWGLAQLRLAWLDRGAGAVLRTVGAGVAIITLALVPAAPHLVRVANEFGHPLGPEIHREGLAMQRHDPPAVLTNALRIGASTLAVPAPEVNRAVADAVISLADRLGVDPQDPAITLHSSRYPNPRWWPDEDHSPYPVQSALVLLATAAVVLGRRVPGPVRAYALTLLGTLVAYAAMVKWQTWGNRLVGSALILGAPLVGWALAAILQKAAGTGTPARVALRGAVTVVVVAGLAHGYVAVLFGSPRPMAGSQSILLRDAGDQRFARRPNWRAEFEWTAAHVRASGAHRVGLVVHGDDWEYPWWLLLPDADLVTLQSVMPHHPPAPRGSFDAILCSAPPDACRFHVPEGWRFETRDGWFAYAVPERGP